MRRPPSICALLTALVLLAASPASASDWPEWRGPLRTGVAPSGDPPLTWSEEENVRFKVGVPGRGLSTPIVLGERIFLLAAVPVDTAAGAESLQAAAEKVERGQWPPSVGPVAQRFEVLALGREDGTVLWRRTAREAVPHESHHLDSSWASASPITDGERVYAHFGSNGTYAYTLDGEPLWEVDLGDMKTRNGFGEGGSPALAGELLVVNWDHEGESFIVALDKRTGAVRWKTPRPGEVTSWATPLVVATARGPQVVVPATGHSRGYDLATGEEIWRLAGMTVNTIPSPVHRDGVVYLTSGFRGNMLQAVTLEKARGDLAGGGAVAWSWARHTPYVASPLLYGDKIYVLKHLKGILSCLDARTGEVLYTEQRLEGLPNVWASPVGAAGRVYVVGREGTTLVLRHGARYEVLASNHLDDHFDASPVISGRDLFLRGREHLYRIAEAESHGEGRSERP